MSKGELSHWPTLFKLKPCGELVCWYCRVFSPVPHKPDCKVTGYGLCGSPWFWVSPRGAIKCIRCVTPLDLDLVQAWVKVPGAGVPDEVLFDDLQLKVARGT